MENTDTIEQVDAPQQQVDPPSKKLYDGLVSEKLYTKSYDDFQKQFSTPDAINKLHQGLQEEKLYTKGADEFQKQFFPIIQKKNPVGNGSQTSSDGLSKPSDGVAVKASAQQFEQERNAQNAQNNFGLPSFKQLAAGQQSRSDNTTSAGVNNTIAGVDTELHGKERDATKKANLDKAITNTAINSLKIKGIKPTAVQLNQEKQKYQAQVDMGFASPALNSDGTPGLKRVTGLLENIGKGWDEATANHKENDEFINMSTQDKINFLNKHPEQTKSSEYIGEREGGEGYLGNLIGQAGPFATKIAATAALGTAMAAAAPETLGGSLAVGAAALPKILPIIATSGDAIKQGMADEIKRRYSILKQQNPHKSDIDNMVEAEHGGISGGIAGGVSNIALLGIGGGEISQASKSLLGNTVKVILKSSAEIGGISGASTGLVQEEGNLEGVKTSQSDIIKNTAKSFIDNAGQGLLLTTLFHAPNILKSVAKSILVKEGNPEAIKETLQHNEDNGVIPPGYTEKAVNDLSEFKQALNKTPNNIPEDVQASIAGLIQKRTNIEKEAADKDVTAQAVYKPQIDAINQQIEDIQRTGKPLEHEIDEATGKPYKQPTYDDEAKQKVEDLADKISKGKRIEEPEDLQTQANFHDELEKQLQRISKEEKSGNKDKENPNTDLSDNIDKYLAKNQKEKEASKIEQPSENDVKLIKQNKVDDNKEFDDRISALDKTSSLYNIQKTKIEKERAQANDYYDSRLQIKGNENQTTEIPNTETQGSIANEGANKVEQPTEENQQSEDNIAPTVTSDNIEIPIKKEVVDEANAMKQSENAKAEQILRDKKNEANNKQIAESEAARPENKSTESIIENTEVPKEGESNTVGISHEALNKLATKIGLPEIERGKKLTDEQYADRGRMLIDNGADPLKIAQQFKGDGLINTDRISVARAHLEDLETERNRIGDEKGYNNDDYKSARYAVNKFATEVVKPMGTEWGASGESLKGERNLDTGSFTAIKQAKSDATGQPQADLPSQIKELSKKVKDIEESNKRLQKKYEDTLNKNKELSQKGKYEKKATEIAKKILKSELPDWLKISDEGDIKKQGIGTDEVKKILADATITMGKLLDKGAEFTEAVKEAVKDLVKALGEDRRDEIEKGFADHYKDGTVFRKESELSTEEKNIVRLRKELSRLQDEGKLKDKNNKRELSDEEKDLHSKIEQEQGKIKYNNLVTEFADKKDNKFTPEQSANIWNYAKKNYIADNPNYRLIDMINSVAMDLGLTPEQVRHALGATPETKRISDEVYRNQYEKNKAHETIQQWVNKPKENQVEGLFNSIAAPFRGLATLGHGHALLFTHAGMNLFDPQIAKQFLLASAKQFKIVYGNDALYQKTISDFKADPLYTKALRSGVGIDPNTIYDDWQLANTFLKKLNIAGNKGFLVLKMMRLEVWKNEYRKLSAIEKSDPETLKTIGQIANHWTGTAGLKVSPTANAFIFAPNLIVSKFARLTTDPAMGFIKLVNLSLGMFFSMDQKAAAKIILKKSGRILAMYLGALAANQGMLIAVGSTQRVNFLHPTKSDWLKFKTGDFAEGKTVDVSSGEVSTIQFLSHLAILPFESQKEIPKDFHGDKNARDATKDEVSGFIQKTLSPFGSTVWDFLSHKDYAGNVLPAYNDKVSDGKEKLSWPQYIAEKLPIPIADGIKTVHDQMVSDGVDHIKAKEVVGGLIISAIASTGIKLGNSPKDLPPTFSEEELKSDVVLKPFAYAISDMPKTNLKTESITDEEAGTKKNISDLPKETQEQYLTDHKQAFKDELSDIEEKGTVYIKHYKDAKGVSISEVSLKQPTKGEYDETDISKLSESEKKQLLTIVQSNSTEKTKKKLFSTSDVIQ